MKPVNLDIQSSSDVRYLNLSDIPKSYEDVVNTVLEERQQLSVVEVDKVKGYVVNIENENQDVCDLTLTAHEVGKFATEFRTKRIWLGISIESFHASFNSWVGEEIKFNIRDFETLDLTMEESIDVLPDLREWLEQVEKAKAEGDVALAKFLGKDLKARQRKCLNEKTKAKLMELYKDTPTPTKKQIQELSKEIMIAEFSIEQWFHKKRRFDKRANRIKARLEARKKNEEKLHMEKSAYWDEKLKNLMSDYYKEKEFKKKLFERLKTEGKRTPKGKKRKLKQTIKEIEKKNLMEDKVTSAASEDVLPQRNLRERKKRKNYIEDESLDDEVSVSEMQENIQQQQNDLFSHMSNSQTMEKADKDNKDNSTPHSYSVPLPPLNSIFSRQVTSTISASTVSKHISDQNVTTQVCSSQAPDETSLNQIVYPRNIKTVCSNMKTAPIRCVIKIPPNTHLKAQQQKLINGQISDKAKDKEFDKQTLSDMPITLTDTESKLLNSSIPICELVPQISDSTKSNRASTPHISDIGNQIPQQQLLKHTPSMVAQDKSKVAGPPKLNCSKTNVLLMVFSQTHHPDISMIQFLSTQLKLSTSSVEKWFEMMRLQNNIS
ncbi:transcription factor protein [Ciona intestinalis]